MLGPWRVLDCAPDSYAQPPGDDVAPTATLDTATTLGHLVTGRPDDRDFWCCTDTAFDDAHHVEFTGLTFPATVYLDGAEVARCESMFLPVGVNVPAGRHTLAVHFGSLSRWLKTRRPRGRWRSGMVAEPGLRWARTTLLGRAPVYGDLPAPVGFWRPVITRRHRPPVLRITADPATGTVTVDAHAAEAIGDATLTLTGPEGDTVAQTRLTDAGDSAHATLAVGDPQLWWPRGYGAQPLYRLTWESRGETLTRTVGFRRVARSGDADGFAVAVNGTPVFCRGAVWVPPDPVGLTADEQQLRTSLEALADAGATMVRLTGGLVYEQPEFWSFCAELGLLVWQDAMQCTFDPPEEVAELLVREMTLLLVTVSGNPALAVVSGGSETLQRPEMLGMTRGSYAIDVIDTALPDLVARHADVPYVRSSPAPPESRATDLAIRPDTGVAHWFGVGGYLRPLSDVVSARVRFAAECLAFSIPPSPAAVERHFGSPAVAGHDPVWKAGVPRDRGASWDFEDVRDFYVREVFGEDPLAVRRTDPERYLQLGRFAVAEAMRSCFAYWRRADSGCRGALVLSAADLTRGAGWGLLDVDGDAKLPLQVLRRTWAATAVTVTDDGLAGIRIDVHNDSPAARNVRLHLVAVDTLGNRVVDDDLAIAVPAGGSRTLTDSDLTGGFRDLSHAFGFGTPVADALEVTAYFDDGSVARDALVIAPRPGQVRANLHAIATETAPGCWQLSVSADVALRYVCLETPGWQPADNGFHLLPGVPYAVRLVPIGEQTEPTGWISSIDATTANPITSNSLSPPPA